MSVWLTIPSARPASEIKERLEKWRDMGYRIALWRNGPHRFEQLPQGEYTFKYRVRAATAGTFKVAPATVQPMYAPEFTAYSAGAVLTVSPGK